MGWVVNATPGPRHPRERPGTHCTGGWVGPGSVWMGAENLASSGIRSPDRPACSELLYRLINPGPQNMIILFINLRGTMRVCNT